MNIAQYIESKPQLQMMNFTTVYQTILCLIADDMLSMDDFQKIKPVQSSTVFIEEDI